jgi:MFS family permease
MLHLTDMIDQAKLADYLARRRAMQNLGMGFLGGVIGALLGALLWGAITALTSFQIGFMAIGVGFLVGFGVRMLGHGMDRIFGYMGAVLSLAGCVLGNILATVIARSMHQHIPFADELARLTPDAAWRILTEGFSLIDLLFYGIAIYFGYHYSFQKITPEELQALQAAEPEPPAAAAPL